MQFMADGHQFVIHFGANGFYSDGTMDGKSKIQRCGSDGQHFYIALGRIDINFFCQETGFKILQEIDRICFLIGDHFPDLLEPFVKPAFVGGSFFVFPVSGQSFFRDLIHPAGTDLYFHPFPLRAHYRSMKSLIPIGFGITEPVAQPFRRRIVLICDHGINFPAIFFLFLRGRIQNGPDGEQIVHFFKLHPFLFHLVPDGMDALGPAINFCRQVGFLQFFPDRLYKLVYVFRTFFTGLGQFAGYFFIRFRFHVLHGQIFHLGLDGIQSHPVGQWRVDINRL